MEDSAAESARSRLHYGAGLDESVSPAEFVIEAITERVEAKKQLFHDLDGIASESCVLATNSSFIPSSQLAEGALHPERVCNMHFFSPVPVMKLVEVVRGPHTAEWAAAKAIDLALALGKSPLLLTRETTGFIVNRVMMAIEREAFKLVEEGIASPLEVDMAVESGLNHPMGPFRLADLVGVDLVRDVLTGAIDESQPAGTEASVSAVPEFLEEMFRAGHLGRRTGVGFYQYEVPKGTSAVRGR